MRVCHYACAKRLHDLWLLSLLVGWCLSSWPALSQAQRITTDGSLGPAGTLQGPTYVVPSALGQTRGPNLFHSFGQFNLSAGESATFTGASSIHNIIGRVTGGSPSVLNGLLRSQIPGANLFLLNPSGVVFGPNAQVDISGSLHVSTADYLRLADGAVFAARLHLPSVLSVAPPEAFGFLGPTPAPIAVLGGTLQVPEGATLSLIGGDMAVQPVGASTPRLTAPGGRLHLASVASAGEVGMRSSDPSQPFQVETFSQLGTVQLGGGAVLDVSGARGGAVVIRGGRLVVDQAAIMSETYGNQDGARTGIDLATTQEIRVTNGAFVVTSALGAGRGGDIAIQTGSLDVSHGAGLTTRAFPQSTGDGGRLTIEAARVQVHEGALLSTAAGGSGRGGDLRVTTGAFTLSGGAGLSSLTLGAGPGGHIGVTAAETLTMTGRDNTGRVQSSVTTSAQGQGPGGRIALTAPTVQVTDSFVATATQSAGEGGAVSIQAGTLTLLGGAKIRSDAGGSGRGGAVTITGTQALTMAGHDSSGIPSGISLTTFGGGAAGQVTLAAPHIRATDGAVIGTSAMGAGRGGDIVVRAGTLELSYGAQMGSLAFSDAGGGALVLETGVLSLQGGGHLASTSTGAGAGGSITVRATDAIAVAGRDSAGLPGTILSVASGTGEAGRITLTAPTISVDSGILGNIPLGGLDVLPQTPGRTGTIAVQAGRVSLTNGGVIYSSNTTSVPGGSILVEATEGVRIVGFGADQSPSGLATLTFGSGDAGHIALSTPVLTLQGGQLSSSAGRVGRTGSISVEAGTMRLIEGAGIFIETLGNTGNRSASMTITADVLEMHQAEIASNTHRLDHGGTVHITAAKLTMADSLIQSQAALGSTGDAGDIVLTLGRGTLTGVSNIESSTQGTGAGGTITLTASTLDMQQTNVFSNTQGPGRAGTVRLTASTLTMEGGGIQAATKGTGRGGDIVITGAQLAFTGGAVVDVNTQGDGPGGRIVVTATDTLTIAGRNARGLVSGFRSETMGHQDSGAIHVTAPVLHLEGGRIAASTRSDGQAGEITVEAQRLALEAGSSLSSASGVPDETGELRVGTGAAGKVTIVATDIVALTGGSAIDTATLGGPGGRILVTTPTLRLEGGSVINAGTMGPETAGDIQVIATNVDMRGGFIITSTGSEGRAGNIGIHTGSLTLSEGALITAGTVGDGNAGTVTVQGSRLTITGGAGISSTSGIATPEGMTSVGTGKGGGVTVTATESITIAGVDSTGIEHSGIFSETGGPGEAGQVTVSAPRVSLMDRGQISTSTGGDGRAGDVVLQVGHLDLASGAQLSSASGILVGDQRFVGNGRSGTVRVTATETVSVTGPNSGLSTTTMGGGQGGDILVQAARVQMADGATMSAQSTGAGDAGRVAITTSGVVQSAHSAITTTAATGAGGVIQVTAGSAIDLTETEMSATVTGGSRPGGSVTLTAPALTLTGGRLAAETQGAGSAGNVTLQVERVTAQGATLTSSSTATAAGDAGTITLQGLGGAGTSATQGLLVQSTLSTTAANTGSGGAITLTTGMALTLDHTTVSATVQGGMDIPGGPHGDLTLTTPLLTLRDSRITAETTGTRSAGDITLNVGTLLAQRAIVSSSSTGAALGNAGTVTLQGPGGPGTLASRLTLTGSVVATTASVADGGNIQVLAQDTLRLRDSQLTTAVRSGVGRGGNILIDPDFVILERSQIRADAFGGPGGNIRLVARGFLTDAESRVSASSAQSVQGTIAIEAFTNPSGLVAPLPAEFVPLATLLSTRCAARLREGRVGSLLVGGRDGLPADPEGGLPSLPVQGGLAPDAGPALAHAVRENPALRGLGRAPLLRLWGGSATECGPGMRW